MNMCVRIFAALAGCLATLTAWSDHAFLNFDDNGSLVVSGPFSVTIPRPGDARTAGPVHTHLKFMGENLENSKAGYFVDDRFVVIEIETTDAPAGTLSYEGLQAIDLAGQEFRTRAACLEISQEAVDSADDPLLNFVADQGFNLVPAIFGQQLFVTAEDGTAEGVILYGKRVDDCDAISEERQQEFTGQFERFIQSIRDANQ